MIPVRHVTSAVVIDLLRRQPISAGKVRFAWDMAAGAALARATTVELSAEGTMLVKAATRAWAREVERSSELLLTRLRELLGSETVARIAVRWK